MHAESGVLFVYILYVSTPQSTLYNEMVACEGLIN